MTLKIWARWGGGGTLGKQNLIVKYLPKGQAEIQIIILSLWYTIIWVTANNPVLHSHVHVYCSMLQVQCSKHHQNIKREHIWCKWSIDL